MDLSGQSDVDALCLQANRWLIPAGAAALAVHQKAGGRLSALCQTLSPVPREDAAVVTEAIDLPNRLLLHCRELVDQRHPMYVAGLSAMYRAVLRTADQHAIRSLALEPLGGAERRDGAHSCARIQ